MVETTATNQEVSHNPQRLLTDDETASMLGTTPSTLSSWRTQGKRELPWVKVGTKLVRYQLGEVLAYIERQKQGVAHVEPQPA